MRFSKHNGGFGRGIDEFQTTHNHRKSFIDYWDNNDDELISVDDYISGSDSVDDSEEYNIEIEFNGSGWTEDIVSSFTRVADYLSDLITTNLSLDSDTSDLSISAWLTNIDGTGGTIGSSSITDQWEDSQLTSASTIILDIADAQNYLDSDQLDAIILHEMIHSLGFGSLWESLGLITTDESGDVIYTGDATDSDGNTPVIELDGGSGTAYAHWDDETYDDELMTGYINDENTLSDMTLAALSDLGYDVNSDASLSEVGLIGVIDGYSDDALALA